MARISAIYKINMGGNIMGNRYSLNETIVVGDNVMIGVHSLIMPGVKIGNNVIIGSHCVVTKDIEDGMIVGGAG